jgi:hypothetical protein
MGRVRVRSKSNSNNMHMLRRIIGSGDRNKS